MTQSDVLKGLARVYFNRKNYEKAMNLYAKSLSAARTSPLFCRKFILMEMLEVYDAMGANDEKCLKAMGDNRNAQEYLKAIKELKIQYMDF